MLTKDNVTIGIEWRFGPNWPGLRFGAKTRRATAGVGQKYDSVYGLEVKAKWTRAIVSNH